MSIEVMQAEVREKKDPTYVQAVWMGIRQGDQEALAKLFRIYYKPLFHYGYRMIQHEELVKDCIQELFLTIWYKRAKISEARSVKSYLLSSMRRMVLRHLQKQRNGYERNRVYLDNFFEDVFNIEDLLIHFETRLDQRSKLTAALDSLTRRQKEVIYLKFYDGLSNSEIASVMDINIQSVYNHASEAIRQLQTCVR